MESLSPTPGINRYTAQLAEHRARLESNRLAEVNQLIRQEAANVAFASLMNGVPGKASRRGLEHVASAATRRLSRWTHPDHGGLDDDDRADLLRQAAIMGVPVSVAQRTLEGVEAAFKARIARSPAASTTAATIPLRHRWLGRLPVPRWRRWTSWAIAALVLLASQAVVVWLWVAVLG